MCIIHEQALHYLFQDLMIAFEQSKTLSALFLKRIGCILCNCKNGIKNSRLCNFTTSKN